MSKKLMYLLGIVLTILLGTYFYWKLCCNTCTDTSNSEHKEEIENNVTSTQKTPTYLPFMVKDANGNLSITINENFNFKESGLNFVRPVSAELDEQIINLKNYLTSIDGKTLSITGYYTSNEVNTSAFPNLGLARANSVKNYLTSKGIPSRIIDTYGKLNDNMVTDSLKVYHGPLFFDVLEFKDDSDQITVLGEELKENPIVLYFNTGEASINLTADQRERMAKISRYLDKVEGAWCIVTGHTDNTGDPTLNIKLGQDRANFAKNYLISNAIPESKITAISKGPLQPIADNATEEGRAKNRRTVITIK
ncbi:OmpA family protein [Tenacibaculum sp. IB213877]|uniref:OmpA family protein n=1 Tax=Tenacibaculum sp. IB213877 TaxID=3097351 RepID=UPI002A5A76E2|nr:OmpA family protein [Tenacibaculum sp. IB213877]MDY0780447.1 OmpA family protein [Tenacibaculum sp. IB213877]